MSHAFCGANAARIVLRIVTVSLHTMSVSANSSRKHFSGGHGGARTRSDAEPEHVPYYSLGGATRHWANMDALERVSGVSAAQFALIDEVNLYERLGQDALVRLSTAFYDR
eukprot:2193950-Prymnesium_polylepis.1